MVYRTRKNSPNLPGDGPLAGFFGNIFVLYADTIS